MRCAITGANGFVGGLLTEVFLERAWQVVALVRSGASALERRGATVRPYDLVEARVPDFDGIDVLIHCAYAADADNLDAARRLFAGARSHGTRILFISSVAAGSTRRSRYGEEKRAIEGLLDPHRDVAIRPGLIIGDGGLFGAMTRAVRRYRLAPIPPGAFAVSTIEAGAFAQAMYEIAQEASGGVRTICAPEPISLRALYRIVAARAGVHCTIVPVPYDVLLGIALVAERLRIPLPISAENVRGLRSLAPS